MCKHDFGYHTGSEKMKKTPTGLANCIHEMLRSY